MSCHKQAQKGKLLSLSLPASHFLFYYSIFILLYKAHTLSLCNYNADASDERDDEVEAAADANDDADCNLPFLGLTALLFAQLYDCANCTQSFMCC